MDFFCASSTIDMGKSNLEYMRSPHPPFSYIALPILAELIKLVKDYFKALSAKEIELKPTLHKIAFLRILANGH